MFIKYGAEANLKSLMEFGKMYFNPCKYFRALEAEQLLKGIGDCNDGGIVTNAGRVFVQDKANNFYEAEEQCIAFVIQRCLSIPIFCLKQSSDVTLSADECAEIHKQFPNHTHALIIEDEKSFLENIQSSFQQKAFSHHVFYEEKFTVDFLDFLEAGLSDIDFNIPKSGSEYYAEIFTDPVDKDAENLKAKHFRIDNSNFFKTMYRKKPFFSSQAEYRIVLPYEKIGTGTVYKIHPFSATLCKIDDLIQ